MDYFNTPRIWTLRVLLIFTFLNIKSNSVKLSDLNRVCVYYFPFDTNKTAITPPKNVCTAVATYGEYGPHPPYKDFNSTTFKGNFPYVFMNDYVLTLKFMKSLINKDGVNDFVDKINQLINEKQIDVLIFDIKDTLNDKPNEFREYSEGFQNDLKSFFDILKRNHQSMLFGLKIHRNAKRATSVFNPNIIGNSTDLYVVRSFEYEYCLYRTKQGKMAPPATPQQLSTTVTDLKNAGFDVQKMFLTIQVDVLSFKNIHKHNPSNWSYSWLCQSHPGKSRKYCRGTLENFYQQGKVVYDNKLPGVFIEAIDCDDFGGNCQCGFFSVSQAILDGMNGSPPNNMTTGCKTFALLPKDRKDLKIQ